MKAVEMKNSTLLPLFVLILWCGCQSLPQLQRPEFEQFSIQKITSNGIDSVTLKSNLSDWPTLQHLKPAPILFDTKNLRVAVIGDTGCRLKDAKGKASYQNCSQAKEWPYPEVTKSLGTENYDFAIHTGDYHYREHCTDPKLCAVYTAHSGYNWNAWWNDFFAPSLPLFKKSPWIFVRGNHEDCSRAYRGWSVLSPSLKRNLDLCDEVETYQWIEMDDLVFINFDDSSFEDRKDLLPAEVEKWKPQFLKLATQIKNMPIKKEIWFVAHKPVSGFVPNPIDGEPIAIKPNMLTMMKQTGLFEHIDFFLSGHIHNQQVLSFPNVAKVQLIVGHGGSSLDPFGRKIMTEALTTVTENKYSFGYAVFHRTGFKKWDFLFKNQFGEEQLHCHFEKNKLNCD